jgi:SAM-dependent methyltransferase
MSLHQRIAKVIAAEGFSGLWPRVGRRLIRLAAIDKTDDNANRQIVEDYHRSLRTFQEKIRNIDVDGLDRFFWYHTIDLGDDLVTPGVFDYRPFLNQFDFPADMSDMTILDVGSATGFFAFEFEKRGAKVTSVELPSLADWDMPEHDSEQTLSGLTQFHRARNLEEAYYLHLDGPFRFCHERMRSKVARHYSTIYNLTSGELKNQQFDLVFLGDILLHLFSPLHALNVVTQLCRHHLIIFQVLPGEDESQPLMVYMGGRSRQGDNRTWWAPNRACFEEMLQRLGFQDVYLGDRIETAHRPSGGIAPHSVIHARRPIQPRFSR